MYLSIFGHSSCQTLRGETSKKLIWTGCRLGLFRLIYNMVSSFNLHLDHDIICCTVKSWILPACVPQGFPSVFTAKLEIKGGLDDHFCFKGLVRKSRAPLFLGVSPPQGGTRARATSWSMAMALWHGMSHDSAIILVSLVMSGGICWALYLKYPKYPKVS